MKINRFKFLLILIFFLTGCVKQPTIKEKINKANYVRVDLAGTGSITEMDLSTKRMYGDQWAVHADTIYSYNDTYKDKWLGFNYFKKVGLLYPILADPTRVDEVKKANYVIVKDVKKNSNQRKIINVWHDDGFKGYKVKIFYNHDCLPVKVQLIDRETNKWKTAVKYSYPHITAKEYEKNWKEYVKQITEGDFLD